MVLRSLPLSALLFLALTAANAQAQSASPVTSGILAVHIPVMARADQNILRFTAIGMAKTMRLEVLNQAGDRVFDSEIQDGSLLAWKPDDGFLPDGLYGCFITISDLSGRLTHRRGAFSIEGGLLRLEAGMRSNAESSVDPEGVQSISLLEEQGFPIVQTTHDGREGRIISGKGGLSFRNGDVFSGKDVELLRLTADGKLGIGVEAPAARLDVEGTIRASEGFQFSDGTVLKMEGGQPVLVRDSSQQAGAMDENGNSRSGGDPTAFRLLATTRDPGFVNALGAGPARILGTEVGAPSYSTFYGLLAGVNNSGINNTFMGYSAGTNNSLGSNNSFIGFFAGFYNTTGNYNAFLGRYAGFNNLSGSNNAFVGISSGYNNTIGHDNAVVGAFAGNANTTGNYNTFLGDRSGYNNNTGALNAFVGSNAGASNTSENYNTFIGARSNGEAGITNATAIGYQAQVTNSNSLVLGSINGINGATENTNVGIGTTAPGYRLTVAGDINIEGNGVIRTGGKAVFSSGASATNLSVGPDAGYSNPSGTFNSFFGHNAGYSTSTGNSNTFIGGSSGRNNTTGSYNNFIGGASGYFNTSGSSNTFVGHAAGYNNSIGNNNTFLGYNAGLANTEGNYNSFVGLSAGYSNTTGVYNSLVGAGSGSDNTTGSYNAFLGYRTGFKNSTGNSNSFIGYQAGWSNTIGSNNTLIGYQAGNNNTTGTHNLFVGNSAGSSNTTENYNTFIGANSDGTVGIANATAVGNRAKVTQGNSLVLGSINGVNGSGADTNVGIGTTAPSGPFHIKSGANEIFFAGWNGKIGIGTSTPDRPLQIVSTPSANAELHIGGAGDESKDVFSGMGVNLTTGPSFNFGYSGFSFGRSSGFFNVRPDAGAIYPNPSLRFMTANQQRMIITANGRVGIGTTDPLEPLHVIGNFRISGQIYSGAADIPVPDYVFEPAYELMPLRDLEKFLESEKHLPNVPSASEIKEKGLNLSEFQMRLLEKIEELTLYTVQQAKSIDRKEDEITALKRRNEVLEAKNGTIEARLAAIEQLLGRNQDQLKK